MKLQAHGHSGGLRAHVGACEEEHAVVTVHPQSVWAGDLRVYDVLRVADEYGESQRDKKDCFSHICL